MLHLRKFFVLIVLLSVLLIAATALPVSKPADIDPWAPLPDVNTLTSVTNQVFPVDFVFTSAFDSEIRATSNGLEKRKCYNWYGRLACIGNVPGIPNRKALALALGTQPFAVEEAGIRLEYNFPPAHPTENDFYPVYTHGGIAGGFYTQFVDGAPNMQPGDSLAAAGACATNTNRFQPYTARGYAVVKAGDTFESIALELTGDTSNAESLYEYNQDRYNLESPADIQPGMALLVPDTAEWPENDVTSFGVAIGGSLYSQGKLYSMIPHEPCLYLSPEALALRDEVLARMDVPPLSSEVITYRQSQFSDARTEPVVFSGDWNEGSGWSWYGDPWIARHVQKFYHVAQGDMETWFVLASVFANHPASIQTVGTTSTIQRGEVDVLIYRSSSDPPDMYPGPAFSLENYYEDPVGVYAQVRAAYNTGIPFPALIRDQSMQFAEFNFTAAEVIAEK
jgi:hypothetical protein